MDLNSNRMNIVKSAGSGYRISCVVSSCFLVICNMPDQNIVDYARLGSTKVSIDEPTFLKSIDKFTPEDLDYIEDRLMEQCIPLGFNVEFGLSQEGISMVITERLPDQDPNPNDDDDEDPAGDEDELESKEEYAAPKVMSAHA